MSSLFLGMLIAALPVPKSVSEAEAQLTQKDPAVLVEAVGNLGKACRGSLRLTLRDHAGVIGKLAAIARDGTPEVKRAVLASSRCFRPAAFSATYQVLIADADPEVAAYALEIVSNTQDSALVGLVLDHEEGVTAKCTKGKAPGEACVWAAYAPSTMLANAPREIRERAAMLAAGMLAAESPKVREVAVESLAATRLKQHAPKLAALIEQEKSKAFAAPNDAALVKRFGERLKALEKGE